MSVMVVGARGWRFAAGSCPSSYAMPAEFELERRRRARIFFRATGRSTASSYR